MATEVNTESEGGNVVEEMELEEPQKVATESTANGVSKVKAEGDDKEVDKSVEEERLEKLEKSGPVIVGPKSFKTSVEMFEYFNKLLHQWSINLDVNEYEYLVLLDLIKQGHPEPENKIGNKEVKSFQIRNHPVYKTRCFFVVRIDGSTDDFSFRKCVDNILPLPENMKANPEVNKVLGGGGRGRGRGRGGQSRR